MAAIHELKVATKKAILESGRTRKEIAEEMRCDVSMISNYYRGTTPVSAGRATEFARATRHPAPAEFVALAIEAEAEKHAASFARRRLSQADLSELARLQEAVDELRRRIEEHESLHNNNNCHNHHT